MTCSQEIEEIVPVASRVGRPMRESDRTSCHAQESIIYNQGYWLLCWEKCVEEEQDQADFELDHLTERCEDPSLTEYGTIGVRRDLPRLIGIFGSFSESVPTPGSILFR